MLLVLTDLLGAPSVSAELAANAVSSSTISVSLTTSISLSATASCSANAVDGQNKIVNGNFDTDLSGWINSTGAWSWSAGKALLTGNGTLQPLVQVSAFKVGATYKVDFDVNADGAIGFSDNIGQAANTSGTVGHVSKTIEIASQTTLEFKRVGGSVTGTIDNISVVQILSLYVAKNLAVSASVSPNISVDLTTGITLAASALCSANAVKGPERIINGDFSSGVANWAAVASTIEAAGGELTVTSTAGQYGYAVQSVPVVVGASYEINITAKKLTAPVGWAIAYGSGAYRNNQLTTSYATSTFDLTTVGTNLGVSFQTTNSATSVTVVANNISVKQSLGVWTQIKLAASAAVTSSISADLTTVPKPADTSVAATLTSQVTATAELTTNIKMYTTMLCRTVLGVRSNFVYYSEASGAVLGVLGAGGSLPNWWTSSPVAGITREVVGKGVFPDGTDYVDFRIYGTNTSGVTGYPDVYFGGQRIQSRLGEQFTVSVYLDMIAGSRTGFGGPHNVSISENSLIGGYVTGSSGAVTLGARSSVSRTLTASNAQTVNGFIACSILAGNTVDMTYRISAPQIENGLTPTAYIATAGYQKSVTTLDTGISLAASPTTTVTASLTTINTGIKMAVAAAVSSSLSSILSTSIKLSANPSVTGSASASLTTSIRLKIDAAVVSTVASVQLTTGTAIRKVLHAVANMQAVKHVDVLMARTTPKLAKFSKSVGKVSTFGNSVQVKVKLAATKILNTKI